ncbi:MAG: hypothetical protein IH971_06985 [Candidatus Marinimicrobia bacterium]|nr:hypothetical protein [Candidatus Neomarinimicrobiota bacterium]
MAEIRLQTKEKGTPPIGKGEQKKVILYYLNHQERAKRGRIGVLLDRLQDRRQQADYHYNRGADSIINDFASAAGNSLKLANEAINIIDSL